MNTLEHKSYVGNVEPDFESGTLFGTVQGVNDVVHYQGRTLDELAAAFRDSVDDYLDMCKKHGKQPEKPYSGQLNLRLDKEIHRRAASVANAKNVSLNKFINNAVEHELKEG